MPEQPGKPRAPRPTKKIPAPIRRAWDPSPWAPADAGALKALMRGDAPPHLQQRAVQFIVYQLCGTYEPAFRPGGADAERETQFALGKQFVGQQIVGLLKVKPSEGEQ